MIACGGDYTIIQNEKDDVYVCGMNYFGQLGLGDTKDRGEFEKVEHDFGKIKNIVCGCFHTVIQNEKNEIYVCGCNGCGQLGLGDYCDRNIFEKVNFEFGKIKNIECGGFHTVIQNEKNEIYVCGRNGYGQLGLGDDTDRFKFERVKYNFGRIKNVACGAYNTIIQNEKNEIYVCGGNDQSQLGLGDDISRQKFEKVEYNFGKIKNIACGLNHTIIQNEKNEIYVCGYNKYGQLGLGDCKNRDKFEKVESNFGEIKKIACGMYRTIIQNEKNEIYVCGYNGCGQLGLGDNKRRNKFKKVEHNFGGIKNIACGEHHTIIQNEKNEIYVCGLNQNGQLGLGDYKHRNTFEKVNTNDIFKKIYNFEIRLNTEEIVL